MSIETLLAALNTQNECAGLTEIPNPILFDRVFDEHHLSKAACDMRVYQQLFPLIQSIYSSEHQEQIIQVTATLAILFGEAEAAIHYLKKLEKRHPTCETEKLLEIVAHLKLPGSIPGRESKQYDSKLWQGLAKKHMPDGMFERILPYAADIETYVNKNYHRLEQTIREKVKSQLTEKLSLAWNENIGVIQNMTDQEFVGKELRRHQSNIKNEINQRVNKAVYEHFNLVNKQSITEDYQKQISHYMSTDEGNKLREKIVDEVNNKYEKACVALYHRKQEQLRQGKSHYLQEECHNNVEKYTKSAMRHVLSPHTDLPILVEYGAAIRYTDAEKNRHAAKLFLKFDKCESVFTTYLSLIPKNDDEKIPNIVIDGAALGYDDYILQKLYPSDPRAALLGEFTGCCQSLGSKGASDTIYGITNPLAGFYVVIRKLDAEIVAQSFAWRSDEGGLVLDSIESQLNYRRGKNNEMIQVFFQQLANQLVMKQTISRVLVGAGGNTPPSFGLKIKTQETPIGFNPVDSCEQRIIAGQAYLNASLFEAISQTEWKNRIISLLHQGANIHAEDCNGNNLLHRAAILGKVDVMEFLMECGIKLQDKAITANTALLFNAIDHNYFDVIAFLFHLNVKVHDTASINNLAWYAIRCERWDMLKWLLTQHVDVNTTDASGKSLLHAAIDAGKIDLVSLLMTCGANMQAKNSQGQSPLLYAAAHHQWAAVRYLADHGGNLNDKDEDGNSLLHYAAQHDDANAIRWVLNQGLSVDIENDNGDTPLHHAVSHGVAKWYTGRITGRVFTHDDLGIAQILFDQRANVNAENRYGRSPISIAAKCDEAGFTACLTQASNTQRTRSIPLHEIPRPYVTFPMREKSTKQTNVRIASNIGRLSYFWRPDTAVSPLSILSCCKAGKWLKR